MQYMVHSLQAPASPLASDAATSVRFASQAALNIAYKRNAPALPALPSPLWRTWLQSHGWWPAPWRRICSLASSSLLHGIEGIEVRSSRKSGL